MKGTSKRETGLSWLLPTYSFPVTGYTQCHDGEHTGTSNGKHVCIVIQLYVAITILCLCCVFSILLYHFVKSNPM